MLLLAVKKADFVNVTRKGAFSNGIKNTALHHTALHRSWIFLLYLYLWGKWQFEC